MNWEDLKVYRPLKKEELKPAYKDFTKIIASNLVENDFILKGRKLIRQSNDLFHIIHLDTRGSWMGINEYFKIEIAICSIYDVDTFLLNYELTASRKIENLVPKIRNHYRITEEYPLLADFMVRKIKESIFPYFLQYNISKDVLENSSKFKLDNSSEIIERNQNLIFYCELANQKIINSSTILLERLNKLKTLNPKSPNIKEYELLLSLINNQNWISINEILVDNKLRIFDKLKIKQKPIT